ncbi:MAG: S-methyl-5-thioribose-1-phosphate isomerase [Thermodesulfobacteriota bacterium]
MNPNQTRRPIWLDDEGCLQVIDQRELPHRFCTLGIRTVGDMIQAIQSMVVRGAPLIGVCGAYGMVLAAEEACKGKEPEHDLETLAGALRKARPTAVNLAWAVDRVLELLKRESDIRQWKTAALQEARLIEEAEVVRCRDIGRFGLEPIRMRHVCHPQRPIQVLTHCNAGWLACIEYGTATAPIYAAHEAGIPVHVWVDETRPLNQGARLTAWELGQKGVPHTVIVDNAGGYLMQRGVVDLVIVGADRVSRNGDAANKIGTYLKALAAYDNRIPFYVAIPSTTIDWNLDDGVHDIPIEMRDPDEVRYVEGLDGERRTRVLLPPEGSPALNPAFDVTPARLITGLITERGFCRASESGIRGLFPGSGS